MKISNIYHCSIFKVKALWGIETLGQVLRGYHHRILTTPRVVRECCTSTIQIEVRVVVILLLTPLLGILKFKLLRIYWLLFLSEAQHSAASHTLVTSQFPLDARWLIPHWTGIPECAIASIRLVMLLVRIRFDCHEAFLDGIPLRGIVNQRWIIHFGFFISNKNVVGAGFLSGTHDSLLRRIGSKRRWMRGQQCIYMVLIHCRLYEDRSWTRDAEVA